MRWPAASTRAIVATLATDLVGTLATAAFLVVVARTITRTGQGHPAWWLVVWGALAALGSGTSTWLAGRAVPRDAAHLRSRLADRLMDAGPGSELAEADTGTFVNLATDGVDKVANYRQNFLGPTIASIAGPLLVLVVVAVIVDPWIALALALVTPVVPLAIRGFQRLFAKDSRRSRMLRGQLSGQFLESIQGLETLVLHRAAGRRARLLAETGERNRQATMTVLRRNLMVLFVTEAVFALCLVSAAVLLARWRLLHGLAPDRGLALMFLCVLLVAPAGRVGSFFYIGMVGRAASGQVGEFLQGEPAADAPRSPSTPVPGRLLDSEGDMVVVDHLVAGHGRRAALDGLDLRLARGERLVLQGPSGGGKSTLLAVLGGDLAPRSGTVEVGGVRLEPAARPQSDNRAVVRAASAVVQQHTWLFTGTIAHNLRIANNGASDADLWRVLDQVGLADAVRRMPDGLQTPLGEQGHALSGGQRQRLSLARALLSDRPLLLLDEPTSQVDLATERVMTAALDDLPAERTVVLVTHRASATLAGARVMELRDGVLHDVPTVPTVPDEEGQR